MPLTKLSLSDFRNFASTQFEPTPLGFNLLYGANGSGKTSLLEAIYYLSFGRSFRSSLSSRVIRHSAEKFTLFAQLTNPDTPIKLNSTEQNTSLQETIQIPDVAPSTLESMQIPIGIERELQGLLKIRIAGSDATSIADLAQLNPVQLINTQSFNLLDGGPSYRRKFIDWGVFYQVPDFLRNWRQYQQILKQRNAALRLRRPRNELKSWDHELVEKAQLLDVYREEYLSQLLPLLRETVEDLLHLPELTLRYQKGWDKEANFSSVLAANYERDLQAGYTQYGPHRADLMIKIGGVPAKDILSRGQQKLFVCAMILAQGLLIKTIDKQPIYLIDDLPAELDKTSRARLIALLSKQETQVFVTAVERGLLSESLADTPAKMFHVEHSNVTELR